ncbi:PilZ domain-containing protein [Sphingorhabdus sp.]|uniref:PilZ domain-containing protein n=1 Tax=Sphingorhabdus sp. TaxID=1902408 RepID=UPI00391AD0A4
MPNDIMSAEIWMTADGTRPDTLSKRKEGRQRVLLRAHIHVVRLQSDLIVTDISRSGLRGTTEAELRVGQPAYISLDDLTHVSGSIRWVQDGRFGMKFSKLLDVLPPCAHVDLGHLPDHKERMPRTATRLKAKISLSSWSSSARIRNVSKTGMMIETELPMVPEQQLLVNLSDGKIFDATVKWVEGDRVGIELATPVSILHLTHGDLR